MVRFSDFLRGPEHYERDFARFVFAQWKRNKDVFVCNSGREGDGKSSLGIHLGLAVDPTLSPNQIILDGDDYHRVYDPRSRNRVYILDEAGRVLFNRRWNERAQVAIVQELMENRQNCNLFILNLPQMKSLDKYAREGRINVWHAMLDQGVAMARELVYNTYEEEARYPIILDRLTWPKIEDSHPVFARAYFARKHGAHVRSFDRRKERVIMDEETAELRRKALAERYRSRAEKWAARADARERGEKHPRTPSIEESGI